MNVAGLVVMLCLGVAAGWVARSELAAGEADRWHAACWRARRLLAGRERMGGHGWLLDAAGLAAGELLPGEVVTELLVGATWRGSPDQVVVTVGRDGGVTREVGVACREPGGGVAYLWDAVDLPCAGSGEWGPG